MSTPTHFDLEIISQTVEAQIFRVPTLLLDDPYVAVRQAHSFDTDTKSRPVEDIRETEVLQPLFVVPSPIPLSDDLHLIVRQAHTPATVDTESEPEEAPSKTKEITSSPSTASSDSTAPLSPNHPLTQTSPTPTPTRVMFHHGIARMAKRYRDEEEEVAPKGQQQAVLAVDTAMDKPLGLDYRALRCRDIVIGEGEMPSTFEVGQGSRYVPKHDKAERISEVRQPALVTWVDPKDGKVYIDILTYVPPAAPVQTPPSPEWSSVSFLFSQSS
nr:hypothetical protein [Tanacetum cinerariifolium]